MRLAIPLALVVLVAGCVAPEAPPEDVAPSVVFEEPPASSGTGAVVVVAMMPDRKPLPGVEILAGDAKATTDVRGEARIDGLAPGFVPITARKAAHRTAQLGAQIVAGEETRVEAILQAETGSNHAHENGVFAHRDLYQFSGHFDCSLTIVIATGDCFLLVDNVTNMTPSPAYLGSTTSERNLIEFPVDLNWTALVVEMTWSPQNEAMGQGMTLALEPAEAPADGHAAKYARVVGGSPLRVELLSGVKHASATLDDKPNPDGGEVLRARAYVMGDGHNPGGSAFLGVGATLDHKFELYVSIFYGEAPPAGYTALEG